MNKFRALIANPNAGLVRSVLLIVLAIVLTSALFWIGGRIVGIDQNGALSQTFKAAQNSPWSLLIVIAAFTAASFVAAPQFLLIAICVAAFGPVRGFAFSFLATLISAAANFLVARLLGASWLSSRRPGTIKTVSEFVGRNGFFTSMIVRIVPSAPFVVVNMGLGLTSTPFLAFIAGTAVGIIPKTALIALLGKVVERAQAGDVGAIAYLAAAALTWVVLALGARWLLQRRSQWRAAKAASDTPAGP